MKRSAPDHRCHGVPVLRDVKPGNVPVGFRGADGSMRVYDLDAGLMDRAEVLAERHRKTFDAAIRGILEAAERLWEERER